MEEDAKRKNHLADMRGLITYTARTCGQCKYMLTLLRGSKKSGTTYYKCAKYIGLGDDTNIWPHWYACTEYGGA